MQDGPDDLGVLIAQEVAAQLGQHQEVSLGVVTSYDATTHKAGVRLEDNSLVDGLRVGTPALGVAPRVSAGTQCLVALRQGAAAAIIALLHKATDNLPQGSASFDDDVFVGQQLKVAGALQLPTSLVLPPADSTRRGELRVLAPTADGVAGTADILYCCLQAADGSLSWKVVVSG